MRELLLGYFSDPDLLKLGLREAVVETRRRLAEQASADSWSDLATSLWRLGRFSQSLIAVRQGLKLDPEHVNCRLTYANVLAFRGQYEEAAQIYALLPPIKGSAGLGVTAALLGRPLPASAGPEIQLLGWEMKHTLAGPFYRLQRAILSLYYFQPWRYVLFLLLAGLGLAKLMNSALLPVQLQFVLSCLILAGSVLMAFPRLISLPQLMLTRSQPTLSSMMRVPVRLNLAWWALLVALSIWWLGFQGTHFLVILALMMGPSLLRPDRSSFKAALISQLGLILVYLVLREGFAFPKFYLHKMFQFGLLQALFWMLRAMVPVPLLKGTDR